MEQERREGGGLPSCRNCIPRITFPSHVVGGLMCCFCTFFIIPGGRMVNEREPLVDGEGYFGKE